MEIGANVGALLTSLGEVDEQIKLLEATKKELKAALSTTFEAPLVDISYGGYKFVSKMMPGRKTLDKAKLEEAGIDLDPYYKVGKPFQQLTIKRS